MTRGQHVPQRSCVACRQVRPKADLLRIVRTPLGEVRLDPTGKAAGRGAYVCRAIQCVRQAFKQRKIGRALGTPVGRELMDDIAASVGSVEAPPSPGSEASAT